MDRRHAATKSDKNHEIYERHEKGYLNCTHITPHYLIELAKLLWTDFVFLLSCVS